MNSSSKHRNLILVCWPFSLSKDFTLSSGKASTGLYKPCWHESTTLSTRLMAWLSFRQNNNEHIRNWYFLFEKSIFTILAWYFWVRLFVQADDQIQDFDQVPDFCNSNTKLSISHISEKTINCKKTVELLFPNKVIPECDNKITREH